VHVVARPTPGAGNTFDPSGVEEFLINLLRSEGDVFAFRRQGEPSAIVYRALVEFEDLDVAVAVASKFNGGNLQGVQLWLTLCDSEATTPTRHQLNGYSPSPVPVNDMTNFFQGMSVSKAPQFGAPAPGFVAGRPGHSSIGPHAPQHQLMYPVVYHNPMSGPANYVIDQTPTRRQAVTSFTPMTPMSGGIPLMSPVYTPPATPMALSGGEYTSPRGMNGYGRYDGRRQNAMRVNRSPYHMTAGHHNQVDVNRIRDGIDVRTTVSAVLDQ